MNLSNVPVAFLLKFVDFYDTKVMIELFRKINKSARLFRPVAAQ